MKMQLYCPFCGKTTEWQKRKVARFCTPSSISFKKEDLKKDLVCSICNHSQGDAEKQMHKTKSFDTDFENRRSLEKKNMQIRELSLLQAESGRIKEQLNFLKQRLSIFPNEEQLDEKKKLEIQRIKNDINLQIAKLEDELQAKEKDIIILRNTIEQE